MPAKNQFLKQLYADQKDVPTADLPAMPQNPVPTFSHPKRALSWQRTTLVLILSALVLAFGVHTGQRHYLVTSLLLMAVAFGAVCLRFERRHPSARELVVIAVLVALAVAGRSAFFMLAQFKPIAAIVIVSGIAFGSDVGFLVGAMSALTSNIFFTQGPWTPWQMLGFGCVGWLAGTLAWAHLLRPNRISMCIFGFFSVIIVYGGILNPASIIMYGGVITKTALIAIYASGFPMDLVHAGATVLFLAVLGMPMLRKLARLQDKYGIFK
ncbi:ECF transporter S component [Lacticaseibacillus hulanensis]|uniref:ECF transporter S component n=1 Tax=Lacticaseibacillus hulanensis TaxID=2493111 RepID=UPI000FD910A3|nr:ECF transporter S component [Lacticaseibacillus hulanensis]